MKKGFTLAEILITLTVIGVVAAITLPSLNANINEQQVGPKLAKAINTLENGNRLLLSDNDVRGISSAENCNSPEKYLSDQCIGKYIKGHANGNTFITNDGMSYTTYDDNYSTIPDGKSNIQSTSNKYWFVKVDTNGTKPMNVVGSDQFKLIVENKGSVIAYGSKASKEYGATENIWSDSEDYCQNKSVSKTVGNGEYCAGSIVDNGYQVKYAYSSIH